MKALKSKLSLLIALIAILFQFCTEADKTSDPVDDVYMYIGTINPKTRGRTPVVKVPGGTVGLFPTFTPGFTDWYLADKLYGFQLDMGSLMANVGDLKILPAENASTYDHDHETATPYYYQILLEDSEINTEFTVTNNTVFFRFLIPENQTYNLLMNLSGNAIVELYGDVFEGESEGRRAGKTFFHMEFSKPSASSGIWQDNEIDENAKSKTGNNIGFFASYPVSGEKEVLEVKIAISRNSIEEARTYIPDEIGDMTFEQVKNKARDLWNKELNLIKVKGGTEKQRKLFYTTLHTARSVRFGNVWDTYRCTYPLHCLIRPEVTNNAIQDWLKRYDETGWLPSSGGMIGNHSTAVIVDAYFRGVRDYDVEKAYEAMKKNHMEGTMIPWRDAMYITELEQCYFDKGFFPALPVRKDYNLKGHIDSYQEVMALQGKENKEINKYEILPYQSRWLPESGVEEWVPEVNSWHRRQSVSVTLEHCYDDWCLAQMAKELGKNDDYELFMKRAHNYQNLFKPEIGMMAPKSADGQWIEPFDPKYSGGFAGEGFFTEANSWIYTWHVQHDVQGLINLMGGKDKFTAKLDELFTTSHRMDKLQFLAQMPDMTGLMGMYCHGNEPAFHIPYLYNYAGQPWKTQKKLRLIMDLWYDLDPHGLSGDEDGGAMTSWYVMTSIGLYPQCPGRPIFDIGSPVFEETTINVGNGKEFVIIAKDVSAKNKYIQSAELNGVLYNKTWISHADMVKGGKIVFQMGPRPNKNWGTSPESVAPSMSQM